MNTTTLIILAFLILSLGGYVAMSKRSNSSSTVPPMDPMGPTMSPTGPTMSPMDPTMSPMGPTMSPIFTMVPNYGPGPLTTMAPVTTMAPTMVPTMAPTMAPGTLCAVNANNQIYCANQNLTTTPNWNLVTLPAGLSGSTSSNFVNVNKDGSLYGINSVSTDPARGIYYGMSPENPNWANLSGYLKRISSNNNVLCGVNKDNIAFCADTNIRGGASTAWTGFDSTVRFKDIAVNRDGSIYGVNPNGVYKGTYNNPSVTKLGGTQILDKISSNSNIVCGLDSVGNLYCADQNITSNPNWTKLPDITLSEIIVNDDNSLFGVNSNNELFYSRSYKNPEWVKVNSGTAGSVKQVSSSYK